MMKNEDIKMLSKGENTDFQLGAVVNKILFILFLFVTSISAQTFLNNFGISQSIKTFKGYSQFRILDFNNDGVNDLFLFGNQEKNFVLHQGNKNSGFGEPIRKFFFYPIDDIKWFAKSEKGEDYYIFVSRKKRLVGLVSFTKNFAFRLLNTIEFNSYPSSIVITDIEDDGINDALIFGSNFNGIVRVNNDGYRLNSEIIFKQSVFSDLIIKDFNQDEVKDLITIDVLNNSISFIENTEINGFTIGREIVIDDELFSLKEFDYNKDSFPDLVVSQTKGLEIILGDSVNSYTTSLNVPYDYTLDKNVFVNLNKDSTTDFIALNKLNNSFEFYSDYQDFNNSYGIKLEGISDFNLLTKKDEKQIILLSKLGKIKTVSITKKWNSDFSFAIGNEANEIKLIKNHDSLSSYLLFSDDKNNYINILQIDSAGTFLKIEKNQFQNTFTDFDYSEDLSHIIASVKGNRLLEISNRHGLDIDQQYLYTKLPVEEIRYENSGNISVLENDNGNLYLETIAILDGRYNSESFQIIDSNVVGSNFANDGLIYYWKISEDKHQLISYKDSSNISILSITDTTMFDTKPIFINDELQRKSELVSFLDNGKKVEIYFISKGIVKKYDFDKKNVINNIDENQIKFYNSSTENKLLLFNNRSENRLLIFKFIDDKKLIILSKSIDGIEINDYFVENFFGVNYLVYSDANNSCLTFKVLD